MRPYTLNLISSFTPWRTYSSTEFFGTELRIRFEKLPHVKLITQCFNDTEYQPADFALIHAYFSTNVYAHLDKLKGVVRKVANFMEEPHPQVDYNWYYADCAMYEPFRGSLIFPPISKRLLTNLPKKPNTILLDHDIVDFWYYRKPELDWNERVWKVMEQFKDTHEIYQIQRHERDATPDFIRKIPHGTPEEYLERTNHMETFVVTHHGSYNHTALEMIARGIRTIVARPEYIPFVPENNINIFGLPVYRNEDELADAIRQPVDRAYWDAQVNKCVDMDAVVALMDHTFQNWMAYLQAKETGHPMPLNFSWL